MSIWQQKAWWKMLVKSNQAEKIFEVEKVFVEKRKVSMWEYWLFVIWLESDNLTKQLEEKLVNLCKKEKCLFIQIETLDYKDDFSWFNWFFKIFKRGYYKKFITPYTALIDLTKSEDDILKIMKPKWRYNIRLAEKKEILVKEIDKTDENIEIFYNLMIETTSRDGFSGNKLEYYKDFLNMIEDSKLMFAYKDDVVISAWIFVFWEEISIYYYWASSSDAKYRNMMAPYLLQWEAIKYSKSIWSKIYDFLWVATPWDPRSSLLWVTGFKMKLTQDLRWVSESFIYVNKKTKYTIINILRRLKK